MARRLSTTRTMLPPRTCRWRRARATPTSNSPSATRRPAWRRIRASLAMSMPSPFSPKPRARALPKWGRRRSVPITRRFHLELSLGRSLAITSNPCARRHCMTGPMNWARCLSKPACGCDLRGFRVRARIGWRRLLARCWRRVVAWASAMFQHSARSTCRARMPARFSTGCIATRSRLSPWAAPAMG